MEAKKGQLAEQHLKSKATHLKGAENTGSTACIVVWRRPMGFANEPTRVRSSYGDL